MRFLLDRNARLNLFMYNCYNEQLQNMFIVRYPEIDYEKDYIIESTGEVLDYTNKPCPWKIELRFDYEQMFIHSNFNGYNFYKGIQCLIESGELWVIPETSFEYNQFKQIAERKFAKENLIDYIISIYSDGE